MYTIDITFNPTLNCAYDPWWLVSVIRDAEKKKGCLTSKFTILTRVLVQLGIGCSNKIESLSTLFINIFTVIIYNVLNKH